MKGKKRNKGLILLVVVLIAIVSLTLYIMFNPIGSNGDVKLNVFEQQWIQNNKNTVIDVLIPNNIPLYSKDGNGIVFSFLNYFEEQTELDFNKTSYNISSDNGTTKDNQFRVLRSDDELTSNDLLFYSDNYVVLSKNMDNVVPVDSLNGTIGVLNEDFDAVSSYLTGSKLTITRVDTIEALVSIFDNNEVSYIIIPRNMYLDLIISKNYYTVSTLNDLSLKYVLTLRDDNNRLNNIIKKYYQAWVNKYFKDNYNLELYNLYTSIKEIDDKSKTDFKSKRYVYGYIDNLPYETSKNGTLNGISGEFINSFASFANIEFNFKKYKSFDELNNALKAGEIDIAFNYYNFTPNDSYQTLQLVYGNYVILTKNNNLIIDTIKSLPKVDLYTLSNTKLGNYMKNYGSFNVKEVDKISSLTSGENILVDYNVYNYYKNKYFKDYRVAYTNKINTNYNYIVKKDSSDTLFCNIFNYYLLTINSNQYINNGINNLMFKTINFDLSLLWLYAILIPILIVIVIFIARKRKKILTIRNDVKLKYIDPLTSLKNRYYLNNNIAKWEENNIYPQSIIVINLNNLKDVNDAYGYEGGDHLIKTAANILINNQLERTDIIRTDGNEFIIYMVGYDESSVIAYIRKLYRLLKDLPYEYGASLGYSMIEDDIKTIEDAINEAILDMVTNRETKKNSDI